MRLVAVGLMEADLRGAAIAWRQLLVAAKRFSNALTVLPITGGAGTALAIAAISHHKGMAPLSGWAEGTSDDTWSGIVWGLVMDQSEWAADAALRHAAHITPDNWRKMKATPYVGETATAILTDDQAATQGHLIAMLDSIVSARKKGHLRNHRTIHLEPALLWRIATNRGMTITIPAIFHAVPLPFMVTNEFDFDGTPARGQRFTWPVDLLPIEFYNSLSPN